MNTIHRKEIAVGEPFSGPAEITFGYQDQRAAFSVWYKSDAIVLTDYVVLATGEKSPARIKRIMQTVVLPDGFTTFHLCELMPAYNQKAQP